MNEHKHEEHDEMQTSQDFGQSHLTYQFPDLRAPLFVGRRHVLGKQLPQRINSDVDLAAAFAFFSRRNRLEAHSCRSTAGGVRRE
ncbi:hypothetical protein SAMN05421548_14525 [Paraburkholderia lycopersici]|uniref:Uncharacterized protein n=1 Tax=Paraburkholderia lycopersici TaxID=416944 RepID=A0A1G7CJJ1_9BURK|nr:hypothetical protein SAMN05421548_14525 [Paraburkholderia lycopersici]